MKVCITFQMKHL